MNASFSSNKGGQSIRSSFGRRFKTLTDLQDKNIYLSYIALVICAFLYLLVGMCYYVSEYHDKNNDANNDDYARVPGIPPSTWFLSFYFVITTMTTLGYGDVVPTNTNGRLFTAWYIIFGVCLGGTYISMLSNHIQEHNEKMAAIRDKETVKKLAKTNNNRSKSIVATIQKGFTSLGRSISVNRIMESTTKKNEKNVDTSNVNDNESENNDDGKDGISLTRISEFDAAHLAASKVAPEDNLLDISAKAFDDEIKRMIKYSIVDILIIVFAIVIAMWIMMRLEKDANWTATDAFYFTVATISTVGYGDFHPTNNSSRVFIIFYTFIGTGLLVRSCTNLVKIPLLIRSRKNELDIIRQFGGENLQLTTDQLKAVFEAEIFRKYPTIKRNENELSKAEFVILLLSMMNRLNEKDLILACKLFDKIDREERRYLDKADINLEIERMSMAALVSVSDINPNDVENNPINIEPNMNLDSNLKASLL